MEQVTLVIKANVDAARALSDLAVELGCVGVVIQGDEITELPLSGGRT